jgi:hypothetical protein
MNSNTKKTLLISGISIVAVGVGFFLGYRLYRRWNKDVIEGKHNTILIDKEPSSNEDVESVGWGEPSASVTPTAEQDWSKIYSGYYNSQYGDSEYYV